MQIITISNNTLKFDDFEFKCVIGKNGKTSKKKKEIKRLQEEFFQ